MENLKLSIVVPVYNTENYLKRCLDSVIGAVEKSQLSCEIIVINDGSKGNCDEIVSEYLSSHKELIKYIKKENSGLADTKNVGIKEAKGEYISFIDSDDFVDINIYKDAFNIIEKENSDVVICDWETIGNDNSYIVPAKDDRYTDTKNGCLDVQIMPSSCNKIVKRSLFENITFPIGLRYEDLGTTLLVLLRAEKISYLNKPYYKYYLSEGSIMRSGFDEKKFQMIDIFNILFDRLEKVEISDQEKEKYMYMVYTRRLYEELIEPIVVEVKDNKLKKDLCKAFCFKVSKINKVMCKNKYFYYNVFKMNNFIKNVSNKFMHFCINNNHYKVLSLILKKRIYYRFFAIRYIGKDIIDIIDKER